MKRLDCVAASTNISLPPCAGAFASTTTTLQRAGHANVALTLTNHTDYLTVAIPPGTTPWPARGVWVLNVQTTCGCYTAQVYVDCPAPQLTGVYSPTGTGLPAVTCCAPPGSIAVDVLSLNPPELEVEGYPNATLLVDDGAAYAIRLGSPVTGLYRWLDEDGNLLASGSYGSNGTTAFHPLDLTCGTYYLAPPGA